MPRNILDLIIEDHRRVMDALRRLLDQGVTAPPESVIAVQTGATSAVAEQTFAGAAAEILAHLQSEESTLYPRLKPEMRDRIRDAEREHGGIKALLQQLGRPTEGMRAGDERWLEKIGELNRLVRYHIDEEERSILPRARNLIGTETLQEIARDFEEARQINRHAAGASAAAAESRIG